MTFCLTIDPRETAVLGDSIPVGRHGDDSQNAPQLKDLLLLTGRKREREAGMTRKIAPANQPKAKTRNDDSIYQQSEEQLLG